MPHTTLVSVEETKTHLADSDWAIVDCRFSLADTRRGHSDYLRAHIPGAVYAHLDDDLSGPIISGQTGRHPLPDAQTFARTLSAWGIDDRVQVVAYDDAGGELAARLWWMLRWLGHEAVAVLDGGWRAWERAEHPVRADAESRPARTFTPQPHPELVLPTAKEIQARLEDPEFKLFDSRSADRYRGVNETIDPVAGHVPGAISAPYAENLTPDGHFRPAAELKARFEALLDETPPEHTAFYCGSGATAAHNLLALAHVGMDGAKLYAGSWSEWITDPARPVAVGGE
ncbi:MAG: sulfurtransferase [Anaerolineales bacterium]